MCSYMETSYLPDRDFISLQNYISKFYKEHGMAPTPNVMSQMVSTNRGVSSLLDDIRDYSTDVEPEIILEQFEEYIKQVKFHQALKEMGEFQAQKKEEEAMKVFDDFSEWKSNFGFSKTDFTDVAETFSSRYAKNKEACSGNSKLPPVTRFYIDQLDALNKGRDLRGQLTYLAASTGVGKSHIARWIGKCAAFEDGLNVLHFQLEGKQKEVLDAYSASLVGCTSYQYETGDLSNDEMDHSIGIIKKMAGSIKVKAYKAFTGDVPTSNIKNEIEKYHKVYGEYPSIIIIDSGDLCTDSSGRKWSEKGERLKRIAVAQDLKKLAEEINAWVVVTYQTTIENREWLNDETNVLTEYNMSESKGLSRPVTHLITLNQSDNERKENVMRIHIAKARFFKRGEPTFKIATDYDHEAFYDRRRSIRLIVRKSAA